MNDAAILATELPAPPVPAAGEEAQADPARDTLVRIAIQLRALSRDLDRPATHEAHALALRRAFTEFWLPFRDVGPASGGRLSRQIDKLRAPVTRLADLLLALGVVPRNARRERNSAYRDVADGIITHARDIVLAREREAIKAVVPRDGTTLHRAPGGAPQHGIAGDVWLVRALTGGIQEGRVRGVRGPRTPLQGAARAARRHDRRDGRRHLLAHPRVRDDRPRSTTAGRSRGAAERLIQAAGLACLSDPALDAVIELREKVVAVSEVAANIACGIAGSP